MSDVDDKIQQWIEMAASCGLSAGDHDGLAELAIDVYHAGNRCYGLGWDCQPLEPVWPFRQ